MEFALGDSAVYGYRVFALCKNGVVANEFKDGNDAWPGFKPSDSLDQHDGRNRFSWC